MIINLKVNTMDWNILSDHLFDKQEELQRNLDKLPASAVASCAAAGAAIMILNALAKGIQKATAKQ